MKLRIAQEQEQLISLETGKLAKEKGYNWKQSGCWIETDAPGKFILSEHGHITDNNKPGWRTISAPTQGLLQKWFRDVHQVYIDIMTDGTADPKFCYIIYKFIGNPRNLAEREWYWVGEEGLEGEDEDYNLYSDLYYTYEEALEEGLYKALTMIKDEDN